MKTNYIFRSLTILLSGCLAILLGVTAMAEAKPRASGNSATTAAQSGRLIIYRPANLGSNVVVSVYVDGTPFGSVVYGQTLDKTLSPGRHVLSVEATPRPTFIARSDTPLDVESGKTYAFTAEDNGSGELVLK